MTFKMPLLSKYTFDMQGNAAPNSKYAYAKGEYMKRICTKADCEHYILWNDMFEKEKVFVKEIIKYGEHLQFLNRLLTGRGALKYRDLMKEFNKSFANVGNVA